MNLHLAEWISHAPYQNLLNYINIFVDFRMMYYIVFILTTFAVQSIYGDLVHGKSIHLYLARTMVRDKPPDTQPWVILDSPVLSTHFTLDRQNYNQVSENSCAEAVPSTPPSEVVWSE